MKTVQYKTKAGKMQFMPVMSTARMNEVMNGSNEGFCLACGSVQDGCEPDARKYTCESCNEPKVYGFEELLMMNLIRTA